MADIVKIFHDVGKVYQAEAIRNYNEISSKNIEKIVTLEITDYSIQEYNRDAIAERFFLRVTSSNGGNLFPFLFLSGKLIDGLRKSFKNMRLHVNDEEKYVLDAILKNLDFERIAGIMQPFMAEKNLYLGLLIEGQTFNERFPAIVTHYIESVCESDVTKESDCFINGLGTIGFDAGLNFCSVNELPAKLKKSTKYRLLPLSKEASCLVQQGFEKIFNEAIFRFRLFGLGYYLLPSIFLDDKQPVIELLKKGSENANEELREKVVLERKLERLIVGLAENKLDKKIMLTFLFANKSNSAIDLYQSIEDVAPSRITRAKKLMDDFDIDASNLSKYIKKSEYAAAALYIRDYIAEPLTLAKLIFGKERIIHEAHLLALVNRKILYGNNQQSYENRPLSKILNGYFAHDTDFEKHQRFIDFLSALGVLGFKRTQLLQGAMMETAESFTALSTQKFETVELFRYNLRAREFYIVGALAQFVMGWQYSKDSDTVAKYLDSIGTITMQNIDRVFRKVIDGSKKYSMHGKEFDALLSLYSAAKSELKNSDLLSVDKANIAFVMGSIDYKNYKAAHKLQEGDAQ